MYVFYNCCQPGCSRLLHLLFQAMAVTCVTIGTISAVELDTITASHLVTMHAWCGAAAIVLSAFQVEDKVWVEMCDSCQTFRWCLD